VTAAIARERGRVSWEVVGDAARDRRGGGGGEGGGE
jgi:hypothetical protein